MFVKFSCGCIGLTLTQMEHQKALIIHPCDLNDPECWEPLGFTWRSMTGKSVSTLASWEVENLTQELNSLVDDGYKFRQVRRLLVE